MSESRRPRLPKPAKPKDLARSLRKREVAPEPEPSTVPSRPVIRRAQAKDLAALVALRALLFAAMGVSTERVSDNRWQLEARRWFQVNLSNPAVNITVADVNGSAVACTIGEVVDRPPSPGNPEGVVGVLGNVATFPEYRMSGLGQSCIDAVMAWFHEETAVTSVELFATPGGLRRYEPHGFAVHHLPHLRLAIPRDGEYDGG